MRLNFAVITDKGKIKSGNQDNFFVNGRIKDETLSAGEEFVFSSDLPENICAVFDGMDGEECGDVASFICARTLSDFAKNSFSDCFDDYLRTANDLICQYTLTHNLEKCGTTLALAHINKDTADFYNLGDSRIYLLSGNEFKRMSLDHTNVMQLVKLGVLTQEQARRDPRRHSLSQYVGIPADEMVIEANSVCGVRLLSGDKILLCTDGLWDTLGEEQIEKALREGEDILKTAKALRDLALKSGGRDNITAIIIETEN